MRYQRLDFYGLIKHQPEQPPYPASKKRLLPIDFLQYQPYNGSFGKLVASQGGRCLLGNCGKVGWGPSGFAESPRNIIPDQHSTIAFQIQLMVTRAARRWYMAIYPSLGMSTVSRVIGKSQRSDQLIRHRELSVAAPIIVNSCSRIRFHSTRRVPRDDW